MTHPKPYYTDEVILQESMVHDGAFHIVSTDYTSTWLADNRDTIIVHNCPKYKPNKKHRRKSDNIRLTYWVMPDSMKLPCPNCKKVPSDKLITLWTLQNLDRFPNDPQGWKDER